MTPPITTQLLDEIDAKADAATPGKRTLFADSRWRNWRYCKTMEASTEGACRDVIEADDYCFSITDEDAQFLERMDVETAKALTREIRALRRKVEAAEELLAEWVEIHEEKCWLDHHGYCQAHYLQSDCVVKRSLAAIRGESVGTAEARPEAAALRGGGGGE